MQTKYLVRSYNADAYLTLKLQFQNLQKNTYYFKSTRNRRLGSSYSVRALTIHKYFQQQNKIIESYIPTNALSLSLSLQRC